MVYIINILIFSFIIYAIWRWQSATIFTKTGFLIIVILKCIFAVYSCYYYQHGDIILFQRDSDALTSLFFTEFKLYKDILLYTDFSIRDVSGLFYYWPLSRAFFMAKILSVFNVVTSCNIYLNSIYFSLFNLFSGIFLINKVSLYHKKYLLSIIISILFIPSIIFNTSGLEKEVLAIGGFYLLIAFGISCYNKKVLIKDVFYLIIGLFLIYNIKYYYLAVTLPLAFSYLFTSIIKNRYYKYLIASIVILISIFLTKFIHIYLEPKLALFSLINANNKLMLRSEIGMCIPFDFKNYSFLEIIKNLPLAIVNGLFGPFIWQFKNAAMFYLALENLVALILSIWIFIKVIKKEIKWTYFGFIVLVYIISWAILLAFYSPNYGTLTRYKVVFMPFLYLFVIRFTIDKYLKDSSIIKLILK